MTACNWILAASVIYLIEAVLIKGNQNGLQRGKQLLLLIAEKNKDRREMLLTCGTNVRTMEIHQFSKI